MSEILMALGDYRFSVHTAAYSTLQRASRYQWPAQRRMAGKPARQFTGLDGDTVTNTVLVLKCIMILRVSSVSSSMACSTALKVSDSVDALSPLASTTLW